MGTFLKGTAVKKTNKKTKAVYFRERVTLATKKITL